MKKKDNLIIFTIVFIITSIIFIPFLTMHFATDTYTIMNVGYKNYAMKWSLKDGRPIMCIISLIADALSLNINVYVIGLLVLALITSSIAVVKLRNILMKYSEKSSLGRYKKTIITVIAYEIVFNFMYLECLYFVECFVMALSVLFIVIAADKLISGGRKNIVKCCFCILISVFSYQATIPLFFALVLVLSLIKNDLNIKKVFKDLWMSILIAFVAVLINIIFVKVTCNIMGIQQNRLGSLTKIPRNIYCILANMLISLAISNGLFPVFVNIGYIATIIILMYTVLFKHDNKRLLLLLGMTVIIIFSSFSVNILSTTAFYAGRMRISLGALVPIMYAYVFVLVDLRKHKFEKYLCIISLIVYVIMVGTQYVINIGRSKQINYEEKEYASEIVDYIEEYEKTNNMQVTKIIKVYSEDRSNTKASIDGAMSSNALCCGWSVDSALNYYLGRKLECIYVLKSDKFLEKEEEYKCIGDIVYIKYYIN